MSTLIVMVVLGLGFAYFAGQNPGHISVNLVNNIFELPVYALVLGSLLVGLLVSGVINLIEGMFSMFEMHGKDVKIQEKEQTVGQLAQRVHDLEIENARLKGRSDVDPVVGHSTPTSKANRFLQKLRYHLPN